jgi:hypothetical protein
MMRSRASHVVRVIVLTMLALCTARTALAQLNQLNESCTISVLNRNVRVRPNGSWVLPNVPANFGPVRARVTCIIDGKTVSGESEPFLVPPNGAVNVPHIVFGKTTPIPTSVAVTAASSTLTDIGATDQLTVTARYADGKTKDVTAASSGTQYTISNAAFATISGDGLVQAVKSGTVLIQATHEGASGLASIRIAPAGGDSDGDLIPDEYELAHGLDPNNKVDASEDPDHDGLTNLQEYQLGTDPHNADTDGDGLIDGQEVARGTNPLIWDTDGDGISDGLEVTTGSNPLDAASTNLPAALRSLAMTPPLFGMTFNTIAGDVFKQLTVTGTLLDGRTIDVTSTARGTNYGSSDLAVCSFGAIDGRVFAGVDGTCTITATLGPVHATSIGTIHTFSPTALSYVSIPGFANNVDINGSFAFVAAGARGLQIVDVTDRMRPQVVAAAALALAGNANDVKVSGSRAYVAAGSAGLHVVDVSNPLAPRRVNTIDTPGDATDVRVHGNLAYVADGSGGLQIIDVTDGSAGIIGSLNTGSFAKGVDVSVDVSRSLAVVAAGGLKIVDVTDPGKPKLLGTVAMPDEAKDVVVNGTIAYVADNYYGSLQVVDFSMPTAPRIVGSTPDRSVGGVLMDVAFSAPFVFGADVFFVNGVPIVDVSTPGSPRPRAILDFRGLRDDDGTGIAVDGNYVYLTASHGIAENGTTGDTRLYIGQYRAIEDLAGIPPTVSIVSPAAGATFIEGETIPIAATASDDVGVAGVSFTVDGAVVFTDTTAPYQFTFTPAAGSSGLTLGATATDVGSNTGTATNVRITVIPDPLTTVVGRVVDHNLQPLAGVNVSVLGRTATTGLDGTFAIAGVPTLQPALIVSATLNSGAAVLTGTSVATRPVRGGTTDVGDIVATATIFESELGTHVARCDNCDVTADLLFDFPIGGTTVRQIIINNGYLRTAAVDYLEAFCCNLTANLDDPRSGLYVNSEIPGRFVVTWYRQWTFDTDKQVNTIQMILFADGRIQFGYHGVAAGAYATVGLFPARRSRYTVVDFSATPTLNAAAVEAVYENFYPGGNPFDLDTGFVIFTPNDAGGYEVHPIPDGAAPVCSVTNPLNGSTLFEGERLSVEAPATDNGVVRRVNFQSTVGGLNVDDLSAPFSVPFVVPVGVSQITFNATAYDNWNNVGACTSTVSVIPGPPPAITVTPPAAGGAVTERSTIPIVVDANNRVPVSSVSLAVNGVVLSTDTAPPFEFLFTVPAGVSSITLSATATNTVGKTATSPSVNVPIVSDALTTVQGTVVDASNSDAPINGAAVTASVHGVSAEVFNFDTPLTALPDLAGATPNRVTVVSALNLRNPGSLFGNDPFGLGASVSRVIRFSANLRLAAGGVYTFTLGVNEGGRLVVNGTRVVDLPNGTGHFQQGSGTITLPVGAVPIQVLTFDNSTPEVQVSYAPAGGVAEVIPPSALVPTLVPYQTTSGANGRFSIPAVPTMFGSVGVSAVATIKGKSTRAVSKPVFPVAGGITDVGVVRLAAFSTLYGAAFSGPEGPASLYEIDPVTAQATLIGPIGFWRVSAMDVSEDGTLYAVGRDPARDPTKNNVLLTIDRTTGAGQAIGLTGVENLGFGDTIADISFRPSDGVLFGYLEAGDGLGTINLTTGATTALGRTRVSCCGNGLAFAPDGRLLHANESALHVLDQTTGVATVLVPLTYPAGVRINSMDFQPDTGELFGFAKAGGSTGATFLVKVDIVSGVVTIVGARTINGLDAITWGPPR